MKNSKKAGITFFFAILFFSFLAYFNFFKKSAPVIEKPATSFIPTENNPTTSKVEFGQIVSLPAVIVTSKRINKTVITP